MLKPLITLTRAIENRNLKHCHKPRSLVSSLTSSRYGKIFKSGKNGHFFAKGLIRQVNGKKRRVLEVNFKHCKFKLDNGLSIIYWL